MLIDAITCNNLNPRKDQNFTIPFGDPFDITISLGSSAVAVSLATDPPIMASFNLVYTCLF
jgi:hypothetical protein